MKGRVKRTSQQIATFAKQRGKNPHTEDGSQAWNKPGHYEFRQELEDGGKIRVYFCDINKKGTSDPMPNSRLEITLKNTDEGEWNYSTTEYGLTGDYNFFRKHEVGKPNEFENWEQSLDASNPAHQVEYHKLLGEVLDILRGL